MKNMAKTERAAGQPKMSICALDRQVLAVAHLVYDCWEARVCAVPGRDHDQESLTVLQVGTKLDEHIAKSIFPDFSPDKNYWPD